MRRAVQSERAAKLAKLVARGWSDDRIARSLSWTREGVKKCRLRQGLACNRGLIGAAKFWAKNGYSLRELCMERRAKQRFLEGWPRDTSDGQASLLRALEAIGPATRRQIQDFMGKTSSTVHRFIFECKAMGWVIECQVGRGIPVYDLGGHVKERRYAVQHRTHGGRLAAEARRDAVAAVG